MSLILTTFPLLIANTNLSQTNMSGITKDKITQYMLIRILECNEQLIGLYNIIFMDAAALLRIAILY